MSNFRVIIAIVTMSLFIVGCSPEQKVEDSPTTLQFQTTFRTAPSTQSTESIKMISPTVSQTDISSTDTPKPTEPPATNTVTPTVIASATQNLFTDSEPDSFLTLKELILSTEDIFAADPPIAELQPTHLYRDPPPIEVDKTDELASYCQEDCAKKIWIPGPGDKVTLIVVETSSPDSSRKAVESLRKSFQSQDDGLFHQCDGQDFVDRNTEFGLDADAFIAAVDPNYYVLLSTYRSSYLMISHRFPQGIDVDTWSHCLSLQFLAKLQIEKLIKSGYAR